MRHITLACFPYDRVRPILDGRVGIEGMRVVPVPLPSEESFPRAHQRAEFDVSELSLSSYLLQLGRGDSPYVAIPAFVSRAFRHGAIYLRSDAGISHARDLEGRRVGIPEYQMTLGLWLRGILADEHGVDTDRILWRTAGTNVAGRKERLPLVLPPHMDVMPLRDGATLNDALLAGELDAVFSPTPPRAFAEGDPRVRRLFPDPKAAEIAYAHKTGFHPIMHVIGIRREVLARDPGLAPRLLSAFIRARDMAEAEIEEMAAASFLPVMLPWLAEAWAETRAVLGAQPFRHGVAANRAELEAICRWSRAQHLSPRPLTVEELFAPGTLES
jgi:4,5-dihydroxyphthalate decarboxylase